MLLSPSPRSYGGRNAPYIDDRSMPIVPILHSLLGALREARSPRSPPSEDIEEHADRGEGPTVCEGWESGMERSSTELHDEDAGEADEWERAGEGG